MVKAECHVALVVRWSMEVGIWYGLLRRYFSQLCDAVAVNIVRFGERSEV